MTPFPDESRELQTDLHINPRRRPVHPLPFASKIHPYSDPSSFFPHPFLYRKSIIFGGLNKWERRHDRQTFRIPLFTVLYQELCVPSHVGVVTRGMGFWSYLAGTYYLTGVEGNRCAFVGPLTFHGDSIRKETNARSVIKFRYNNTVTSNMKSVLFKFP